MGRPLTQGLFLEIGYGEDAVYSLKEYHHTHKDKTYPSLKLLYIEIADPTEYEFANACLIGWKHWMRLVENKVLRKHIDEWRDELEIKLRSQGVKKLKQSAEEGNYQASKYLADKGWDIKRGRPSKEEIEREKKIQANISDEFSADIIRLRG